MEEIFHQLHVLPDIKLYIVLPIIAVPAEHVYTDFHTIRSNILPNHLPKIQTLGVENCMKINFSLGVKNELLEYN